MADTNDALLAGRLGEDPVYTEDKNSLWCAFRICNQPWMSNQAKYWIPVECTKRAAEIARDELKLVKGDNVRLTGMLQSRMRDVDGKKSTQVFFRAYRLYIIYKKRQGMVRSEPTTGSDVDPAFATSITD